MQHFPFPACREKGTPQWTTPKVMIPRGVGPWGVQIGIFRVHETYFCKIDSHFFNTPHAAFPLSACRGKGITNRFGPFAFHDVSYPVRQGRCQYDDGQKFLRRWSRICRALGVASPVRHVLCCQYDDDGRKCVTVTRV